jgi:hypothetical protein
MNQILAKEIYQLTKQQINKLKAILNNNNNIYLLNQLKLNLINNYLVVNV